MNHKFCCLLILTFLLNTFPLEVLSVLQDQTSSLSSSVSTDDLPYFTWEEKPKVVTGMKILNFSLLF